MTPENAEYVVKLFAVVKDVTIACNPALQECIRLDASGWTHPVGDIQRKEAEDNLTRWMNGVKCSFGLDKNDLKSYSLSLTYNGIVVAQVRALNCNSLRVVPYDVARGLYAGLPDPTYYENRVLEYKVIVNRLGRKAREGGYPSQLVRAIRTAIPYVKTYARR